MGTLSAASLKAYRRYWEAFLEAAHLRAQHGGSCYPADRDGILDMVRGHFAKGVGPLPETWERDGRREPLPGLVVPHLDFRVGGPVYSYGYRELLRFPPAEVYVILGVGHRCPADISVLDKGYRTALGEVSCCRDFIDELARRTPFRIDEEPLSHHDEHSIEFVVIYLQALAALYPELGGFSIVPVLCGAMHEELLAGSPERSDFEHFAGALSDAIAASGRRVCVIGSIDGSHVGPRFQHPFKVDVSLRKKIETLDRAAFAAAARGDAREFFGVFLETFNAQGFDGVGVLYIMLRLFGGRAAFELLAYDQWHEKRDHSMVTLASGAFRPASKSGRERERADGGF